VALKEGGELAAWRPDGKLLAAPSTNRISLIGLDGAVKRQLLAPGVKFATWPCECRLGWSRSGSDILFLTTRQHGHAATVGSVAARGGPPRTARLGLPAGDAAWSPDGWPLVFVANAAGRRDGPSQDLWRLDGLGARPHKLLAEAGEERHPQFSPDGTHLLYLRDHGGWRSAWVVNADGSNPHRVARRLWLAVAAWSPDSGRVAVAGSPTPGSSSRLYLVSAAGGRSRPVRGVSQVWAALAWSPDGHWIAYSRPGGEIWRVHPDGSRNEKIGDIPDHDVRRLLWSPDGRHLAYTARFIDESD
jgi:Tol biopolymer transport system component